MPNILANFDYSRNQIMNAAIHNLATAPSSPVEGQVYFNTGDKRLYCWNGTQWTAADALGAAMTGANIVTAINGSASVIDLDNLAASVGTAVTNSHTHSNKATLDSVTAAYTTAEQTKLSGIEAGANVTDAANVGSAIFGTTAKTSLVDADTVAITDSAASNALAKITYANLKTSLKTYTDTLYNNYSHPNHTGDVTSTGDGATVIGANKVTNAMLAQVATATFKGRSTGGTGNVEDLSVATVKTMLGLVLTQTANATGFSIAGGTTSKTLTVSNTLTLAGTDSTTMTFPSTNATIARTDAGQTFTGNQTFSANISAVNAVLGFTTTATAAGTTTLTVTSARTQVFTGTTTQTVVLPVTSTLTLGHTFDFFNNSTGAVTIQSSGANNVIIMGPNTRAVVVCVLTSGTTAASWDYDYKGYSVASGKVLTVSNTLTLTGTDGSTLNVGTGGTLGTAAYTASTAYATAAQGTLATNAVPNSAYTAVNDILVGTGAGAYVKKTPAEIRTILNVADGANAYTHPNHTGDVTSTGDGATVIANNAVTLAKMATIATDSFLGRDTASTGNVEVLSVATVKTMLGLVLTDTALTTGFSIAGGTTSKTLTVSNTLTLAGTDGSTLNIGAGGTLASGAFAAAYSHPTGDGNLHVPANGTSNSGKVLTAGASAGTYTWNTPTVAWADVSSKPSSSAASIDSAVSASHSQNTDTGTTSATFTVGSSGVKIKNSGGTELQVRINADSEYGDLRVRNLVVEGTTTTINSNTVAIGDSEIELNSDITTNAANSDGGLAIKRLMADNTTRKDAKLSYNNSSGYWQTTQGDVAGTLVTAKLANKFSQAIGDGAATSYVVTHNLNTRDLTVTLRETAGSYAMVITDVEFTTVNTATIRFAVAPSSNQYTVTFAG